MVLGFKERFKQAILDGVKIHTIREDSRDRWQPGKLIHMATGVRTKQFDCFSYTHNVVSVQELEMHVRDTEIVVHVEGKDGMCALPTGVLLRLAYSDGFNSLEDFTEWFMPILLKKGGVYCAKLIHWTDYRY